MSISGESWCLVGWILGVFLFKVGRFKNSDIIPEIIRDSILSTWNIFYEKYYKIEEKLAN